MIAWAYVRVSGDAQADRGLPVAGQREELQRYADAHSLILDHIYIDEARVGSSDDRPEFQRMIHLAHRIPRPVDQILLWSWSRFSRDQNDAHFHKADLRRLGIEIIDISGETPQANGFEYVLESLIHWKDEQRLQEISHDARRGQQTLARLGYIPSGCLPPRGYRVQFEEHELEGRRRQLRRWVPDPATWPLVQRAWQLRLQGQSYHTIIAATGLYPTPGCLTTFFANTAYYGLVTFGGTAISVEAIVTKEEWDRVNRNRRSRHGGAYPRRQGSRFLLSGLLTCARCGAAIAGDTSPAGPRNDGYTRRRWDCYICINHKHGRCDLPRVSARALETAVVQMVLDQILTPEALDRQLATIQAQRDQERPAIEARLAELRRDLARTDAAITNLLDSIEQTPSPALTQRLTQRETERDLQDQQIANLEAQLRDHHPDPQQINELRGNLTAALSSGQIEPARALLRALIHHITLDDQEAKITYCLPFPTRIQ